ncbi:peroxisomal biogenesis factor 14 [Pseudohyphozyma bogoriensis]|nr:peroxisomal biogenesis factor 14 [Pseudohyphozyma bogoriensis]
MSSPGGDRQALLTSAITFLRDPSTAASPLAQRVAFLESKGLSQPEIEQALAVATSEFDKDWRDWFIMGVIGGTVGWLGYKVAQKFLMPHLAPPSATELEAAQLALEAKYDEAASLLASLQTSTDALAASLDEQKEVVDHEIGEVKKAVQGLKEGEEKRDKWCKRVEQQVDEVVKGLPSMLEKQAASQAQSLTDLQTELKSLKSLMIARQPARAPSFGTSSATAASGASTNGSSTSPSDSSSALPGRATGAFTPRAPGIPSWQLKGNAAGLASGSASTSASSSGTSTPVVTGASGLPPATGAAGVTTIGMAGEDKGEDGSASGILVEKPVEAGVSASASAAQEEKKEDA